MTTTTETTPDVAVTDNGDHDRFQHYFPKDQIDANLLTGAPMRAICGKVVEHQVDPKGRTICQTCQDLYDNVLQPGDDEGTR